MRTLHLLGSLSLSVLVACSGSSTPQESVDQAVTALNSGDYSGAAASLEGVLATLEPGDPLYKRAKISLIEAQINLDAEKAKNGLLQLAQAHPDVVDEADFRKIGGKMTSAKKYLEAIDVIHFGIERYPESPVMEQLMEAIVKESKSATVVVDPAVAEKLKGLGYL